MSADGGVRAISGFLFQVLAGGALRAAGECHSFGSSTKPELDALIELARVSDVVHEFLGQDLALRQKIVDSVGPKATAVTLVQVKFSVEGPARSISSAEMSGILAAFAKATTQAEASGAHVSGYALITNRSIDEAAPARLGDVKRGIYDQLQRVPDAQIALWHQALERFARQFGCNQLEMERGRQALVGKIFEMTAAPAARNVITRDDLLESFTGSPYARELTPVRQAESTRRGIAQFDADVTLNPVRRELLVGIEGRCAGRALVVFSGDGGSGKTAALHHWCTEIATRASGTEPSPLTAIRTVHGLPADWLSELVHEWNPASRPNDPNDALHRLEIANGDAVPVVHLGLDGADEYPNDIAARSELHRIAQWFWSQDQRAVNGEAVRARLVVTCRDSEAFSRDCLSLGRSGGALAPAKTPLTLTFGRFSEAELRAFLRDNFPHYEARLLPPEVGIESTLNELGPDQARGRHPLCELLLDPVMWRSFCLVSDEDRERLFSGDRGAETRLAKTFCERFLVKAESRTGIKIKFLRHALEAVAKHNHTAGRSFRGFNDWQNAAHADSGLSKPETRTLFEEAASGGIIRIEQLVRWDWRDDIVERYFLTSSTPD